MPTRYFQQPAGELSILQMLAGYGQGTRETAIANAALRTRQNEIMGAGIGKGISNALEIPAQDYLAQRASDRELQQQLTLQRQRAQDQLKSALAIEEARIFGNVFERDAQDFYRKHGRPYTAVLQEAAATGGLNLGGLTAQPAVAPPSALGEFGMSLPSTGESMTFPQPPQTPPPAPLGKGVLLPLSDPSQTRAYRDAQQQIAEATDASNIARKELNRSARTGSPVLDEARNRELTATIDKATRNIMAAREVLGRYQEPKPPATFEEMAAAGANNGGITISPDGSWLVPKGMTRSMPPKAAPKGDPAPWLQELDPVRAEQMKADDFKKRSYVGPDAEGKPTLFLKQDNGEWAAAKTDGKADSAKPIDYAKQAEEDWEFRNKTQQEEGETDPQKKRREIRELSFALQMDNYNADAITQAEWVALGDKLEAAYGPNPRKVPEKLWRAYLALGERFRKTKAELPEGYFENQPLPPTEPTFLEKQKGYYNPFD